MKVFERVSAVQVVLAFVFLAGCGIYETKNQNPNSLNSDGITLAEVTPNTKLSYANIRDLVILPNCKSCHVDGSRGGVSLKTYADVKANLGGIEASVFNNNPPMPPAPATMPALAKSALKQWIDQGAPETVVDDTPAATPTPDARATPAPLLIVSYAQVSAQVFFVSCKRCHMGGAAKGGVALDTYDEVIKFLPAIQSTVFDGVPVRMPRNGLPADQKLLLKTWIDLGAQEGVVVVPTASPSATPNASPIETPTATPASSPTATPIPSATPEVVLVPTFTSIKAVIFDGKCLQCHMAGARAAKLPLDNYAAMLAASNFVIPGNVAASSLVSEIVSGSMPPKRANLPPVTAEELAVIKTWIINGAPQ